MAALLLALSLIALVEYSNPFRSTPKAEIRLQRPSTLQEILDREVRE